jgi:hypothetical protein
MDMQKPETELGDPKNPDGFCPHCGSPVYTRVTPENQAFEFADKMHDEHSLVVPDEVILRPETMYDCCDGCMDDLIKERLPQYRQRWPANQD